MARYIDAEKMIERIKPPQEDDDNSCILLSDVRKILYDFVNEAPIADVVEVVRCKDCDVPHNKWTGCPYMNGIIPPPNHFCSYGERKTVTDTNVGGK